MQIKRGELRIIAGLWRGRKLSIPSLPGLRPTPDRVRETLFNWLHQILPGAYCLDAFAGSGALGFEALSRGAKHVVFIDQLPEVIKHITQQLQRFQVTDAEAYVAILPLGLHEPKQPFDLIFLDPPYQSALLQPCCEYLEQPGFLAKNAYIYLESARPLSNQDLPKHWQIIKHGRAGQVSYHLVHRAG